MLKTKVTDIKSEKKLKEIEKKFFRKAFWFKQALSASIGLLFGIIGFTGIFAIGVFLAAGCGSLYFYSFYVVLIDGKKYEGEFWNILKDSAMVPVCTFLVCWVSGYTLIHFSL